MLAFGRYEVIAHLASGGSANIFLAREVSPVRRRLICLKTLRADRAYDQSFRAMFFDEARIAMRLRHPSCVETFEMGELRGVYYISMELVFGESLYTLMMSTRSHGPLPAGIAAAVIAASADALGHAHDLKDPNGRPYNAIHRDISPHNIMISYEGRTKLLDFGIVKAETDREATATGVIKGKYSYMSPEQISGEGLDRRSDIYSLGIVLFEILTAKRLFKADTPEQFAKMLLDRTPPRLRDVLPSAPPELDAICAKALAQKPWQRYSRCEELAGALRRYLAKTNQREDPSTVAALLADRFGPTIAERRRLLDLALSGTVSGQLFAALGAQPVRAADLFPPIPDEEPQDFEAGQTISALDNVPALRDSLVPDDPHASPGDSSEEDLEGRTISALDGIPPLTDDDLDAEQAGADRTITMGDNVSALPLDDDEAALAALLKGMPVRDDAGDVDFSDRTVNQLEGVALDTSGLESLPPPPRALGGRPPLIMSEADGSLLDDPSSTYADGVEPADRTISALDEVPALDDDDDVESTQSVTAEVAGALEAATRAAQGAPPVVKPTVPAPPPPPEHAERGRSEMRSGGSAANLGLSDGDLERWIASAETIRPSSQLAVLRTTAEIEEPGTATGEQAPIVAVEGATESRPKPPAQLAEVEEGATVSLLDPPIKSAAGDVATFGDEPSTSRSVPPEERKFEGDPTVQAIEYDIERALERVTTGEGATENETVHADDDLEDEPALSEADDDRGDIEESDTALLPGNDVEGTVPEVAQLRKPTAAKVDGANGTHGANGALEAPKSSGPAEAKADDVVVVRGSMAGGRPPPLPKRRAATERKAPAGGGAQPAPPAGGAAAAKAAVAQKSGGPHQPAGAPTHGLDLRLGEVQTPIVTSQLEPLSKKKRLAPKGTLAMAALLIGLGAVIGLIFSILRMLLSEFSR